MNRRLGLLIVGSLLVAAGLAIWLTGDFAVAARRAPRMIRFAGAARALAGLAPVLVGLAFFGLSSRLGGPEPRWPQWAAGAGIACAIAAFALAERG